MALTNSDISKISQLLQSALNEALKNYMSHEETQANFREVLTNQDIMMKELKVLREEHDVIHYRVYANHEKRINTLEQRQLQ